METKNNITLILAALFVIIASLTIVYADQTQFLCLTKGQQIEFSECNPAMDDRTCGSTSCTYCVVRKDSGVYCPASPNKCNSLGLSCTPLNGSFDQDPPILDVHSPTPDSVYVKRGVLMSMSSDEDVDMYLFDHSNPRRGWKKICQNCDTYGRARNFNEGPNNISLKALDDAANEVIHHVNFFVDSKDPRIRSTLPKSDFADGSFSIEFSEANPHSLILHYGNPGVGMRSSALDLSLCTLDRDYSCSTSVDLSDYNGQDISYWFVLTDIANQNDTSKEVDTAVDSTKPVIDSLLYETNGRSVLLKINYTEANLDSINYLDLLDSRAREKTLCRDFGSNYCEKKISLADGPHMLNISIKDEAGNIVTQILDFFTDSKNPKISKTLPRGGFANGQFGVEFIEANPDSLVLKYGNTGTGFRTDHLNLGLDCISERNKEICGTSVNLADYDSQEIFYWFELTDKIGNVASSKPVDVDVDTTLPVLNSLTTELDGRTAQLSLEIIEANFEEASYINNADRTPRSRRLCSSLKTGNLCEGRIRLKEGTNSIDITILDEAGNSIPANIVLEA